MKTKIIVFDLDGTLTPSKGIMDSEMSELFSQLLEVKKVAVISGGKMEQFKIQLLSQLLFKVEQLHNLFLFPLNGTCFYKYRGDKSTLISALKIATSGIDISWGNSFGDIIEDRDSQITFSALGQEAPLKNKKVWDVDRKKRNLIKQRLQELLPKSKYEIRIGGTTSIDILRRGRNKAFGVKNIIKDFECNVEEILFIGDALFEEGNDYPVKEMGVKCIEVKNIEETKKVIKEILDGKIK